MECVFVNRQIYNTGIHKHVKMGVLEGVKKRKGKVISVKMWFFFPPHNEHKHASFAISAVYARICPESVWVQTLLFCLMIMSRPLFRLKVTSYSSPI